jgi:UDP-N-acetyl-D-mannosaminuronic acid dehydrogenase
MANCFAEKGYTVLAVDTDRRLVDQINSGVDPYNEPGLQSIMKANIMAGKLKAVEDLRQAQTRCDTFIISVPTPVRGTTPDLSALKEAVKAVANSLREGDMVVIVSSIPPGTINGEVTTILENRSGLKAERDFALAYCPERIAPSNALSDIAEVPRLIGGVGTASTERALQLFGKICKKVVATNATTAEVSKLAENTFRDVNIAFANELALLCEKIGVDCKQVIAAANTHPRVNILNPGPGVGGPCIPKDPWLLIAVDPEFSASGVMAASRARNDGMPDHILELSMKAVTSAGKVDRVCVFSIMGTAYKAGLNDTRLSPSEPVIRGLIKRGHTVRAYDPYSKEAFGAQPASTLREALNGADCMIMMTDHSENRQIDLSICKGYMADKPAIVDGRRIIDPLRARMLEFAYYGVGC